MKAADHDWDAGCAQRAGDIERARILVGLHADQRDQAEVAVPRGSGDQRRDIDRACWSRRWASMSMSTSGPSIWRSAQSSGDAVEAASEFDGITERNHWMT